MFLRIILAWPFWLLGSGIFVPTHPPDALFAVFVSQEAPS